MYPVSIDLGLAEYKGFIVYHKVVKVNILCKKFKNIYSHLCSGGVQYTLKIHKLKSLILPIAQPFLLGLSDFMYMHNTFTHLLLVATSSWTKFRTKQVGMLDICKL